jgi:MFS family permease
MLQALRIRDFRLLWGGSLVSDLGSWLLVLAIPAHIFLTTGSLRDTGLTLAAQYLPLLVLGPVAGVFTDRWDRRRLMIVTSLFRACAVAIMLLGTAPGHYWVLYVALIAESGGGVLYSPAAQARTPAIVGTGTMLSSANSLSAFCDGATRLIGGPLGGVLLTVYGVKWLICADALSYLLAAAAIFMTSRSDSERVDHVTTIGGIARDLIDGVHVLRHQPVTRALLPVTVVLPGRGLPHRRSGPSRGPGPSPGQEPADRQPDGHRRRVLPAVQLIVAHHGAASGSRDWHIRLDEPGNTADRDAAGNSQRDTRPGQRRLPDR